MFTQKWFIFISLSICFLILACGDDQFEFQETVKSAIEIDLRGLNIIAIPGAEQEPDQSRPSATISVVESLNLMIQPREGQKQMFSRDLTQRDSVIIFEEVEVETGLTVFSSEILSNNGTQIYFGSDTLEVNEDGFEIQIQLNAVDAVLAVTPDTLIMNYTSTDSINGYIEDTFRILNKGVKTLDWRVKGSSLQDWQEFLEFVPNEDKIIPPNFNSVEIFFYRAEETEFNVTIGSQVGDVELKVLVRRE